MGKVASLVYGVDLGGSSAGALLAGIILLPVLGIANTLYLITALNLSALGLLGLIGKSKMSQHE